MKTELEKIKTNSEALKKSTDEIGASPNITTPTGVKLPCIDTTALGLVISSINTVLSNSMLEFVPVTTAPTASSSNGNQGEYIIAQNFFYFCVAKNTWIKIQLTQF